MTASLGIGRWLQPQSQLLPDVIYIDQDDRLKKDFVLGGIEDLLGGRGNGSAGVVEEVKVKVKPTVLDSGNGLSIILPVDTTEFLKAFQSLSGLKPVKKILRFCAQELS